MGGGDQARGSELVIHSKPDAPKVRNIAARPAVALHFDTDPDGHDVAVLTGEATIDPAPVTVDELAAYVAKYRDGIAGLGMTPESMVAEYNAVIRVTIERTRGY